MVTKTKTSREGSLDYGSHLDLTICGRPNNMCCHIYNLRNSPDASFLPNAVDSFRGTALKECQNFEVQFMSYFIIKEWSTHSDAGLWEGVYIELRFNNGSKLHCDLRGIPLQDADEGIDVVKLKLCQIQ